MILEQEYLEPILIRWIFRLVLPFPKTSINSLFLKKKHQTQSFFVEAKIVNHSLSAKTSDTQICFELTFSSPPGDHHNKMVRPDLCAVPA